MDVFPISFRLKERRIAVVGTSDIADAKARGLERAGAIAVRIDPNATILPELSPPPLPALVAVEDPLLAELWAIRLRGLGYFVNVADRPDLCDFLLPAIVDRSPVLVTITTGGASATLSRRLRERIEALLPARLGRVAERIAEARPLVAERLHSLEARRAFWDQMLAGPLDPFADPPLPPPHEIAAWTNALQERERLFIIHLASADLDDVSLKALRCLQSVERVVAVGEAATPVAALARRDAALETHATVPEAWPQALSAVTERTAVLIAAGTQETFLWPSCAEHIHCGKAGL